MANKIVDWLWWVAAPLFALHLFKNGNKELALIAIVIFLVRSIINVQEVRDHIVQKRAQEYK